MNRQIIRLSVLVVLILASSTSFAATCTSIATGRWDRATTWSCNGGVTIPGANDDVIIVSPHVVDLRSNNSPVTNLTIQAGATLFDNGKDLTASGSVVIDGIYDGTGNNGNLIMTGNGQTLSGTGTVIDIGRIQIDANITIPAGSNLNLTLGSEIRVGDQAVATLTIDGTITGTNQTNGNRILRVDNNNASNVIINGTINAPNSFIEVQAGGTVTNNGTVTVQYLDGNRDATATWTQGNNSNLTLTQPAQQWTGTFNASATGNTVTFNGTATQFNPATYYNIGGTNLTCPHPAGITVLGSSGCAPAGSCTLPWGGFILDGASTQAYSVASVPVGSTCPAATTRTCTAGVLSGAGNFASCVVAPPTPCGGGLPTSTVPGGSLGLATSGMNINTNGGTTTINDTTSGVSVIGTVPTGNTTNNTMTFPGPTAASTNTTMPALQPAVFPAITGVNGALANPATVTPGSYTTISRTTAGTTVLSGSYASPTYIQKLTSAAGTTLQFAPGDYYIDSITVGGSLTVSPAGLVRLFIGTQQTGAYGNAATTGGNNANGFQTNSLINNGGDPANLQLLLYPLVTYFEFNNGTQFTGIMYQPSIQAGAPKPNWGLAPGQFDLHTGVNITGSLYTPGKIETWGGNVFNYTPQVAAAIAGFSTCPPSSVHHFAIGIGAATASTCAPKSITITAQNAANGTVANYTGTVNITTSSGNGDWSKVTANGVLTAGAADSGVAGYSFVAADTGVITLALDNQHAESLTVSVVDSVTASSLSTSGAITFADDTFVITNAAVQVAGKPQAMTVEMWRKDATTGNCSIASNYTGNKGLKVWLTLDADDPAGTLPSIGGSGLSASSPFLDNLTLAFAAGSASFNLDTSDVGKYVLNLLDDSGTFAGVPAAPIQISGSSGAITTRPFALVVRDIKQGATVNPAGSGAAGAKFAKAGSNFQATIGAYKWNAAADANSDGVPDAAAALADIIANGLTPSYKWPVTLSAGAPFTPTTPLDTPPGTGAAGVFNNGMVPSASFSGGLATPNTLNYMEVGSFTLSGVATSFLNTGGADLNAIVFDSGSNRNAVVGRFYPASFAVTNGSIINRSDIATCIAPAGCDGFTYMGERMTASFTLTAKAADGVTTTTNYQGGYAKLSLATTGDMVLGAVDATATRVPLTARLDTSATATSAGFAMGAAGVLAPFTVTRSASEDGPFDNLNVGIAPVDSDAVATTYNLDTTNVVATTDDRTSIGTTKARYGRVKVSNAYGSELLPLTLTATAQYFTANGWTNNLADSVTNLTLAATYNLLDKNGNTTGTTAASKSPASGLSAGRLTIDLAKPSGGAVGVATINPTADAYLPVISGTATFGIYKYKGNKRYIYRR